jgi:membrane protein implicated in regulation of membrane protease activity
MNMEADDVLVEQPLLATTIVAAGAAVAYAGVQLALDGAVAPLETAVFVVVFTAVYVLGNRYLRRRERDGTTEATDGPTDESDADPE